jgi:hypothetical protein
LIPRDAEAPALCLSLNAAKGSPHKINLHIEDLTATLADNVPDELTDLLEIAAYVYCADQFTSRGSSQMSEMGAEWRREFRFVIPVRKLSVWRNLELREALASTLSFLSEDSFEFDFVQARSPAPIQNYLGFQDPAAQTIAPEQVILFSGGLDSLAGAAETILGHQQPSVLISHQGSTTIASRQNTLAAALRARAQPRRLMHIPVSANKGGGEAVGFTQRTRSFLFACLGLLAARMFGLNGLRFFENGIVSINLPAAEHVIGARASRTTHPRFLSDCSKLFSLLTSQPFELKNPYIWKTKADVVRMLADHQCDDLIAGTLSCTRVRDTTKHGRQCGVCSQCVDRRIGILAAGLGAAEPPDNYSVDLFRGAHKPGPDLTLVESYVNQAQKFASMSELAFKAGYGQVYRVIPHLPGSADENIKRVWQLHRRQGRNVVSVIDQELRDMNMQALAQLPPTSLLAMIMSRVTGRPVYVDPVEKEPTAVEQARADTNEYSVAPIHFARDEANRKILFDMGISLGGAAYELIAALMKDFQGEFQFVQSSDLADDLGIDEESMRKRVNRTRKKLEEEYFRACGRELGLDDVIENQERIGYRLSPHLFLVTVAQLRSRAALRSQVPRQQVTTSRPIR